MSVQRPAGGWPVEKVTTHPGTVLLEDFLLPLAVTANYLAQQTRMPATRIGEIIHCRRGITPDTALRLARYFGTSPEFWLNLQAAHDLSKVRIESGDMIMRDVHPLAFGKVETVAQKNT